MPATSSHSWCINMDPPFPFAKEKGFLQRNVLRYELDLIAKQWWAHYFAPACSKCMSPKTQILEQSLSPEAVSLSASSLQSPNREIRIRAVTYV